MAVLASVTRMETFHPAIELVKGTVTTSGDTYSSRLGKVIGVLISDRTTLGGARASTISGQTITITCTNGDVVDMLIWGLP
mgnify:CR=1 FL=1